MLTLATAAFSFSSPAAKRPLPLPTPAQLAWQAGEIMALIHFNMATFVGNGDPGCGESNWADSSKPTTFAPTQLDTDNWAASMKALGVKEAVLTAKHGCGFAIWPTTAKLPDGSPYGYNVPADMDVLQKFTDSMSAAGIGHGFYYSLTNNFFLNVADHKAGARATPLPKQVNVSQAEFEAIATHQVTELWTKYGNLTEIWFDGGYTSDMKANLGALLARTQPTVAAMNGGGIAASPVRWVGTEGDMDQGYEGGVWSTYCCNSSSADAPCVVAHSASCALNTGPYGGAGCAATGAAADAACDAWYPAGLDYTLQAGDVWFWMPPPQQLRPLSELIAVYHASVGRNTVLELDFAIDQTGRVDPTHAELYGQFGGWISSCYGTPIASARLAPPADPWAPAARPGGWTLRLDLGGASVDRVVLREDQSFGQRVLAYAVRAVGADGRAAPFSNGTAVGNKRIDLGATVAGGTLELEVVTTALGLPPIVEFAAFKPCASA